MNDADQAERSERLFVDASRQRRYVVDVTAGTFIACVRALRAPPLAARSASTTASILRRSSLMVVLMIR